MFNLNNTRSTKCGYSPEQIEEQQRYFQEVSDFHRLIKLKENKDRTEVSTQNLINAKNI